MELFVQIFIAVATGCSAVFMYVELLKKRPFARADVLDLSGSEIKGSDAERLQAEGYYQLVVEIHGGQSNCRISQIEIKGGLLGELPMFSFGEATESIECTRKKIGLNIDYEAGEKRNLYFAVKPTDKEKGPLKITLTCDSIFRIHTEASYQMTQYF